MLLFGFRRSASAAEDSRPPLKSLRYDEDYQFLVDPAQRTDFWDFLKYIAIGSGDAGYLSLGGEARERFEAYQNEFFSTNPNADNAYFLQRYLLHADYHPVGWSRAFGQLQSSLEDGRPTGPRPTDRDSIDVHQLFGELAAETDDKDGVTLRVGRQEMSYGSERLISVREGPNNRRAFDAARILYKRSVISVDGFFSSPVEVDTGAFDDQNLRDVWFWGGYATLPLPHEPDLKFDFYYLGLHNPRTSYSQGVNTENRHTIGSRFFGKWGQFDLNNEVMYQFGEFGLGRIEAWSVATDHGYTFDDVWAKPRVGLKAAIASGDRGTNSLDLQTFSPLFPRGNYFTEASLIGPQNFFDVHPCLQLHPFKNWSFDTGLDFYWRESLDDGIYTPGGAIIYNGNRNLGRFVGTDFSFVIGWTATRHFNVSAAYTHFFVGDFIRDNGGADVNYGAIWATYKF